MLLYPRWSSFTLTLACISHPKTSVIWRIYNQSWLQRSIFTTLLLNFLSSMTNSTVSFIWPASFIVEDSLVKWLFVQSCDGPTAVARLSASRGYCRARGLVGNIFLSKDWSLTWGVVFQTRLMKGKKERETRRKKKPQGTIVVIFVFLSRSGMITARFK